MQKCINTADFMFYPTLEQRISHMCLNGLKKKTFYFSIRLKNI